jgi:hypothetical protein
MIRNPKLLSGMYQSCCDELLALSERSGLSSYLDVNQLVTKSFLLSCASFYEDEISTIIKNLINSHIKVDSVSGWIHNSAIDGQFYKWFDFRNNRNATSLFAKFGTQFKSNMRTLIDSKQSLKNAEIDFMELCQKRNETVHRNYAAYSLDYTLDEIYHKHLSAMKFIRAVEFGSKRWLEEH